MLSRRRSGYVITLLFAFVSPFENANAQSTEGYFRAQIVFSRVTAAIEARQLLDGVVNRIHNEIEAENSDFGRAVAEYQRTQSTLPASEKSRVESELRTRQGRMEAAVKETEIAATTWQNTILQWVMDELRKIIEQLRIEFGFSALKDLSEIVGEPKGRDVTESIITRMNSTAPHLPARVRDLTQPSFPASRRTASNPVEQVTTPAPIQPIKSVSTGGACKGEEHRYGEDQRMLYLIRTPSAEGVDFSGYWKEARSHYAMKLNADGTGIFNVDAANVYVNVEWYLLGECDGTIKSLSPRPDIKIYVIMMKVTGRSEASLTNYPDGQLFSKMVHNAKGYWSADGMVHQ
ncbi:MAG TPA: OmpH family outer membrane protein [Longimicrobiales bacterium]|nr:OmpH family outer membrane protein [Longimicrobiales bacterium]